MSTEEIYRENIIEHYKNPQNYGELKHFTIKKKEFNPLCGDEVTVYANMEKNKIKEISFVGKGCAISQAATSMLTEHIKGWTKEKIKKLSLEDIKKLLGIEITGSRTKCATLSLRAIQKGIDEQ